MANRNDCGPNKVPQNYRPSNSINGCDRYRLPAISNRPVSMSAMNSSLGKPPLASSCAPQAYEPYSNLNNTIGTIGNSITLPSSVNCEPVGAAVYNARIPSYNNYRSNDMQQVPAHKAWSSNRFTGVGQVNTEDIDQNPNTMVNRNINYPRRPMTSGPGTFNSVPSNFCTSNERKTIVRDHQLANEILQKAGIPPCARSNACFEVITDTPVTINDTVNCDPNPLCMKKPANCQECYEQSIVVRHLQAPRPPAPPPIIIRERCAPQLPIQSPIVIRQIPPRPSTPPPLIIRECPPPMPDIQEPTIIEREVPPPPPPPRQVIVERLPTPPPKPRPIIFEKWLPYEEPQDRPCIVEKAKINEIPPPKNMIIQYEAAEPRVEPLCINEGISYVDPKQFVNDQPNGNAEVCYVDRLNNLPDHVKCQLSPQALAAIGFENCSKPNTGATPYVIRTNPAPFYQQNGRAPCISTPLRSSRQPAMMNDFNTGKPSYSQFCKPNMYRQQQGINRAASASMVNSSPCYNKYNTSMLGRSDNQGINNLARAHYNPWATTYQVSYTNKGRGVCRAR